MRDIRADTIYYVVLDRFVDADPTNNSGKNAACTDPTRTDSSRYWGGDIQGLLDKIDYLAHLGVSSLRITPVFEQMHSTTLDRGRESGPFHGFWARDLRRLDPHLLPPTQWDRPFSARDTVFDDLVQACHERGMRLIVDFVAHHSNPGGPDAMRGEIFSDGRWLLSWEHDQLGWYHRSWAREGSASEATSREQAVGLDKFDEANASFRQYLYSVLLDWIDRGVDGFCFDSVHTMPVWFWQELTSMLRTQRPDVSLLSGWYARSRWESGGVDFAKASGLRMIDMGLHRRIEEALCCNDMGGFRRVASYFDRDEVFTDATSLVTFIDTHRTSRLLSSGLSEDHLLLATTLLMTARGIPCLLYGTEQSLRGEMSGSDFGNCPMMQFDDARAVQRALPRLAALRRDNLAVQRGAHRTLWLTDDVYVFCRIHAHDSVLVVLNRGEKITVDLMEVPFPDGAVLDVLNGAGAHVKDFRLEGLTIPAGGAMVFAHTEPREIVGSSVLCCLSGYITKFGERIVVTGDAPELGQWDIDRAVPLHYVNRNLWIGDAPFGVSRGSQVLYKYAVIDERGSVQREVGMPRTRQVPLQTGSEWSDRWG